MCEGRGRQGDSKCGGRVCVKVEGGKEIASKCGGRVCVKLEGGGGVRDVGRLAFCDVVVK